MATVDSRGLEVSTGNARSLEQFDAALHLFNGYYGDPLAVIDDALAEAPDFAMGHALRAGLVVTSGDGTAEPMLRQSVEAGEALHGGALFLGGGGGQVGLGLAGERGPAQQADGEGGDSGL